MKSSSSPVAEGGAPAARVAERLHEVGVEDEVDPGVDGRVEGHHVVQDDDEDACKTTGRGDQLSLAVVVVVAAVE